MNTIVTSQIAKLLEEKGFDEPCYDAYNSRGNRYSDGWCEYIDVGTPFTKSDLKGKYTLAPTIADVVMWLYKEHGIWVQSNISRYGIFYINILKKEATKSLDNPISWEMQVQLNDFNSPTEAYLAAIDYTLNNLI